MNSYLRKKFRKLADVLEANPDAYVSLQIHKPGEDEDEFEEYDWCLELDDIQEILD